MTDEQVNRIIDAVVGHGNQLGVNLVHLKAFLKGLQEEQHQFLAEQRAASDRAQSKAHWTAIFAAIAAGAAAVAACVQSYAALVQTGAI